MNQPNSDMWSSSYDVIVVGLGAAGASALYQLAKQGKRVLGLEQFAAPNQLASHHGYNRIIRLAYAEDPSYVPLLQRAYRGWQQLETDSGVQLLHITGSVHGGLPDHPEFNGALQASREHGIPHEVVDAAELMRRYPGFRMPADHAFVLQPSGGFVAAEPAITAYLDVARSLGADIHAHEPVLDFSTTTGSVSVRTASGTYSAESVIFAAGAWMGRLIPQLAKHLTVRRQVVGWFETRSSLFDYGRFPTFLLDLIGGDMFGFPVWGRPGFKIGRHHHLMEVTDPDSVDRTVSPRDEAVLRDVVARYFPDADGPMIASGVGLYTNTRDEFFILDTLPGDPHVVIASPCSGHGFKFSPVLGEILADLATRGATEWDISKHRLSRLETDPA